MKTAKVSLSGKIELEAFPEEKTEKKRKTPTISSNPNQKVSNKATKKLKKENIENPMLRALTLANTDFLKFAVDKGININHKPPGARDFPIFYGILKGGESELFLKMLDLKPDLSVKSNAFLGYTPLEYAISRADVEATRLFLMNGAKITDSLKEGGFEYIKAKEYDKNGAYADRYRDTFNLLCYAIKESESHE